MGEPPALQPPGLGMASKTGFSVGIIEITGISSLKQLKMPFKWLWSNIPDTIITAIIQQAHVSLEENENAQHSAVYVLAQLSHHSSNLVGHSGQTVSDCIMIGCQACQA